MTAAAFDTIKLAEHLHGAGFTKKQASGLAEGLASALADHPRRDTVIEAIQDSAVNMTRRIDAAVFRRSVKSRAGQFTRPAADAFIKVNLYFFNSFSG